MTIKFQEWSGWVFATFVQFWIIEFQSHSNCLSFMSAVKLTWKVIYQWKRQSYLFLANLFLKQGISSEYVIVDFIRMGLLDLWGAPTENYKMKNSCPQWDSNQGPSAYEANALSVELLQPISIDHLKVTAFYMSFLCKLPVPRGRCNSDLSCIFFIWYLYRFAVWLIKTFADCK